MIYVYGIVAPADPAITPQVGLEGVPVETLAVGQIGALWTGHERFRPEARLDALQQHHEVVAAAMTAGPVLPARFGTTFADLGDLERVLTARQGEFAELIRALKGKVELAVRMRAAGESGSLDECFSALASRALAAVVNRRQPAALAAAFLVRADDVAGFQQSTARILGGRPDVRASLTGPWPPYNFTDPTAVVPLLAQRPLTVTGVPGRSDG